MCDACVCTCNGCDALPTFPRQNIFDLLRLQSEEVAFFSLSRTRTVLPVDTPTVDERVVQPMLNPNRNQVRKEPRNGHGLRYTAGHPCGCVIERIHASRGEKEKAGPKNAPTSCLPAAIPSLSAQNTTFPWTHERARSRGAECMLVKGSCSSLSHMHLASTLALHMTLSTLLKHKTLL